MPVEIAEALGVDCMAFAEEPADGEPVGPGRPPKRPVAITPAVVKKAVKGRKRKE